MSTKDVLGRELDAVEAELLATWRQVESLLDRPLPPCAQAAVKEASSALWQAVNDLALTDERPRD